MAKKRLKVVDKKDSAEWEAEQVEAKSKTKLEDDKGTGQTVVLRFFDFGANVETFKQHKPTGQELFNSHLKGIETLLWRDGLTPFPAVQPRLLFSKDQTKYRFIVACTPLSPLAFKDTKTLSEIAHETIRHPK